MGNMVQLTIEAGTDGRRYVVLTCPACGKEMAGEPRQAVTLGCAVVDMARHVTYGHLAGDGPDDEDRDARPCAHRGSDFDCECNGNDQPDTP